MQQQQQQQQLGRQARSGPCCAYGVLPGRRSLPVPRLQAPGARPLPRRSPAPPGRTSPPPSPSSLHALHPSSTAPPAPAPAAASPAPTIIPPIINIAPLLHPEQYTAQQRYEVQGQLVRACQQWGFFHVTSHGIPDSLQSDLQQQMKLFFHAAPEVKGAVRRTADNSRGWADDELTKQQRDVKQIFDVGPPPASDQLPASHPANRTLDGYNQWPAEDVLPGFRPAVQAYFDACTALSRALLLEGLAGALGPEARQELQAAFEPHTSFLRLNYYPLLPEEEQQGPGPRLGISRHTDSGALTLILQDSTSALEVWSGSKEEFGDGCWVPVDPVPGALTVNTGDMLMVWSNGRFKAPEHRVRAMTKVVRYSAPYFYNPSYSASVAPLGLGAGAQGPEGPGGPAGAGARYRPIVWGRFRAARFAGDYADVGKEVQIEDFLISPP